MPKPELATEKFRLYSALELLDLTGPEWLIEKLFPVEGVVGVYGPSGHAKSFLALDWALSIARGGEWLGRSVRQGTVVYVAAEGGHSIRKRVAAWMRQRACPNIKDAFFLLEGVQIRKQEDVELLAGRIEELNVKPVLIVLDTLARCFVGGDENSAQEMGQFVVGLDWLRQRTGASMMVLHHTGKQAQEIERGSTALRAAADVMIRVSKTDTLVTVHNNKQKDDEEFKDVHLRLKQVAIDGDTSCVLEAGVARFDAPDALPAPLKKTLSALSTCPHETATTMEWATRAVLKERTLHSHRKALVEKGFVEEVKRGTYRSTEAGRSVLGIAAGARHLHIAGR